MELNRKKFWHDVVTAALYELRPNSDNRRIDGVLVVPRPGAHNCQRYNQSGSRKNTRRTNQTVHQPSSHNQCLDQSKRLFRGPSGRASATEQVVPFLFIVDEAAYLYQSNYMHSFMWVLDQPIMKILTKLQTEHSKHQRVEFLCFNAGNAFSDLSLCTSLHLSVGAIFYWRTIYSVGVSQFRLGYWSTSL